jgi:hypothetical protein
MEKTVVALFDNLDTAQTAVKELLNNGFARDDISVIRTNQQGDYTSGNMVEPGEGDASGAAAGAGIGAVLGGLAGLLVGLGALAIPGVGPIIAAGPIATTLAGAGIGAATGGLVGALADTGLPEKEAGAYAEGVRRGGTLVTVRVDEDQVGKATEVLDRFTPVDINQQAGEWQSSGWSGYDANAGPYSGSTGESDAEQSDTAMAGENRGAYAGTGSAGYTGTGTSTGNTPAAESRENLGITTREDEDDTLRTGHGEMCTSQGFAGQGGGTYEQMQEEDAKVHPRSSEGDYHARRDFLGGPETQGDYHRDAGTAEAATGAAANEGQASGRSHVTSSHGQLGGHQGSLAGGESFTGGSAVGDIGTAATGLRGGSTRSFEDHDPDFRSDWESNYRGTGGGFERYQPAYQYGWQLGEQYQGQEWDAFQANARADWERTHPDDAWRDFQDAIRRGWEQFREGAQDTAQNARQAAQQMGDRSDQGYQASQSYDRTAADMSRSFDIYDPDFRTDWEQSFRDAGYGYERYQPAYQYGYNLATESRYNGQNWNEIESEARRDWEMRHPNDAWEDFKDAVRHAWSRVRGSAQDAMD